MKSALRLLQISDPHLLADTSATLRGVNTLGTLQRVLSHARAYHWDCEALLVTGDLVHDQPAAYRHFRTLFAGLGKPVYCIPGNHDDPVALRTALASAPFQCDGHADLGDWRVVLLDSCVPGQASGAISDAGLAALERSLATAGSRHVLLAVHHHPVTMDSRWLDQVGLTNADEFFRVVDRFNNVRSILWGHVHQPFDGRRKGVRLLAVPSTCAQFLPRSDEFAVDPRPPAYRQLTLRADGTVETNLIWLEANENEDVTIPAAARG
ncbi:MAG TPA: 3',5'-cyclic-AMP phosphodiesterase [Steroidobacteraceae bacterium]|nr:3',5'-cyclic-AMP phosphodiesterase [Steroidobacteraceae bacterium]